MTIDVIIVAGNFPYGNPGSLGEPLGLWNAQAAIVGDASGGFVRATFVPQNPTTTPTLADQRLQYVYFVDGVRITGGEEVGNFGLAIRTHFARANQALSTPFSIEVARDGIATANVFAPSGDLFSAYMSRIPIFWDTQELRSGTVFIVQLAAQTNVLAANYRMDAYGRYYDRAVVGNRAFGRLVSPEAVSQFQG